MRSILDLVAPAQRKAGPPIAQKERPRSHGVRDTSREFAAVYASAKKRGHNVEPHGDGTATLKKHFTKETRKGTYQELIRWLDTQEITHVRP